MKNSRKLPQFSTLEDLKSYLFVVLPNARKALFSAGKGFDRSQKFYELLGNPQDIPKTIHIAGTSGKGSTAYYLSALLISHGFKVGTHVSPHVFDLRESSMIDLKLPSEEDFVKNFKLIIPKILNMQNTDYGLPTYFEAILGATFTLFDNQKVDYSVIETGLGGKYDSTNTISKADKLSVITKIGLDHTEVLGNTLEEIANQKAGIINQNSEVIAVDNNKSVTKVFKANAQQKNASLDLVNPVNFGKNIHIKNANIIFDYDDGHLKITGCTLSTFADYQVENACLAISVFKKLSQRDAFEINTNLVKKALSEINIPGRCELREYRGKKLIIDGAHNPQKMSAFTQSLDKINLDKKPIWLIGMKKDKDLDGVIEQILPRAQKIICTEFFKNSDNLHLRKSAVSAVDLQTKIKSLDPNFLVEVEQDPIKALNLCVKSAKVDQQIIISGSLYLLSEINVVISNY